MSKRPSEQMTCIGSEVVTRVCANAPAFYWREQLLVTLLRNAVRDASTDESAAWFLSLIEEIESDRVKIKSVYSRSGNSAAGIFV